MEFFAWPGGTGFGDRPGQRGRLTVSSREVGHPRADMLRPALDPHDHRRRARHLHPRPLTDTAAAREDRRVTPLLLLHYPEAQYASADGARLSILCVLDMTSKLCPVGTPENYIFELTPELHGLTNPEAPSLVVAVVINAGNPTPSSRSRRKTPVADAASASSR